jgi:hypothetical protein
MFNIVLKNTKYKIKQKELKTMNLEELILIITHYVIRDNKQDNQIIDRLVQLLLTDLENSL